MQIQGPSRAARWLFVALLAAASFAQSSPSIRVNGRRINDHLTALSRFGANPQGGVSRVAYSDADLQGRAYAISLMEEAHLDVQYRRGREHRRAHERPASRG